MDLSRLIHQPRKAEALGSYDALSTEQSLGGFRVGSAVWGGLGWFGVVWGGLGWFGVVWGGLGRFGFWEALGGGGCVERGRFVRFWVLGGSGRGRGMCGKGEV